MNSGVQIVPVHAKPGVTLRRVGVAVLLLLGAAGLALTYSLNPERPAIHVPASAVAIAPAPYPQQTQAAPQPVSRAASSAQPGRVEEGMHTYQSAADANGRGQIQRRVHVSVDSTVSEMSSVEADATSAAALEPVAEGEGRALEPTASYADTVLYITNVGDRIVVSRTPDGQSADAAPAASAGRAETSVDRYATTGHSGNGDADNEQASEGTSSQRPDYEDVYPGCPRVLPPGANEVMALERKQLYGCLYFESCQLPEGSEAPSCTWYLMQKLN